MDTLSLEAVRPHGIWVSSTCYILHLVLGAELDIDMLWTL